MTIKTKYIDPFTDFGFKKIFGSEENKKFLISFLNDLLDITDAIKDIQYRNLEKLGLNIIDRKAVFDVYCTDVKGNNFIVELQRSQQRYFKDQSIYYTSFPIQEQSKKGDWDYKLNKVYFVGILDFEFNKEQPDQYLSKVVLKDQNNNTFYDKLTYYYLEMPKFKKTETELANHLEYWLFYLNNLVDTQKIPEKLKNDELLHDAFDVAEFLALDKDEQFTYQHDLKVRLDYKNCMNFAIETAIERGIEQGIEQGRHSEKVALAKKILKHLDLATVASMTGLSVTELENLSIADIN
jgi:predicted transposase/invertase (TIGR01784 family)